MTGKKSAPKKNKKTAGKAANGPKKKGGRPPNPKVIPEFVQPLATDQKVISVELASIDTEDKTFMFRTNLRVADLVDSLKMNGQKMPIILRKVEGKNGLQIVSGFRRIAAIQKIGWPSINAIVLEGISDEEAWKTSVVENEARKTYSDLERAYAIMTYRKMGHTVEDIAKDVFKLSRKQTTRLNSLVELPEKVQEAVGDNRITTTHALVLKQLRDKFKKLEYAKWINRIVKDKLSVSKLRSAIQAEQKEKVKDELITLFVKQTDKISGREVLRFRPVKVDPEALTNGQRKALVEGLQTLLERLKK